MQITRADTSPTKVHLKVVVSGQELEPIKKHVLANHFADTRVPGFRGGRAPLQLIEKNIDQRLFLDEFMEHSLNELYRRALDQEKLRPVGQPQIELKKFVPYTEMEFEATQEVVGAISLPDYKTIKLAKPKVEVTAKDVSDILKSLQTRMAERKQVQRPAKASDEIVIDFSGRDPKGNPVAGASGKDYPLVLGSKTFIPGFEENLLGLKTGEEKTFEVTFPSDYGVAALQGKKVTFKVAAKKISELVEPQLDDEFAAKAGPFKTLAELKADVKKQIAADKKWQAERDYESQLIKKIADKSKVEIPESLVEEQLNRQEAEEKRNLVYRGQTWQEHLASEGVTEEQHRERHRPEAEDRVKAGLVLAEISDQEGLEVTAEEINTRIDNLKAQYQDQAMLAELAKPESRQEIASRILTEKTIAKLTDYALK